MDRVGILGRWIKNDSTGEVRTALDVKWGEFFKEVGVAAYELLPGLPIGDILDDLNPSYIVFSGGNNLSFLCDDELSLLRDEFEGKVLNECLGRGIPVVGICRGAQFMAHKLGFDIRGIGGHVVSEMELERTDSKSLPMYDNRIRKNSYHDFGIWEADESSTGVEVIFKALDGSVEMFQVSDKKLYAMMWHPERYEKFQQDDLEFFRSLA